MYKHKVLKIAHHVAFAVMQMPKEILKRQNYIIKVEGFHLHGIVIDAVSLLKDAKEMPWCSAVNAALICKEASFDGIQLAV